ncbi:MAG: hypothetical protein A2X86_03010 [Bdellovibrionales bacterium GWA2_49_15]|nr:MAG: hypothetical protein A2X86_03010 [Bdellovibrionales bacterium GWA2_49_15]HAZ14090.1 hypothetical protein [Bdellovibrionales bacterium]
MKTKISRRGFLQLTGSGIFLFFFIGESPALAQGGRTRRPLPTDFNAFLKIDADGKVHCFTGKIEMGQGIYTGLAMMLADELDVPLESVNMVMGDTDLCPWDMGTWGSLSTRVFGPALRGAGSEARQVLLQLASEKLNVSTADLFVKNGVIFHKSNKAHKVSYGELAQGRRIERRLSGKVGLKKSADFKIMGKIHPPRDAREKVTGAAKYTGDIRLPGMLYAKILRPKFHGATLLKVDLSEAQKVKGVHIVRENDFIAVLHENSEVAESALGKIKATFAEAKPFFGNLALDDNNVFDHLLKVAIEGKVIEEQGNLAAGAQQASVTFEQTYLNDYVAHAAIEPHTAVIQFNGQQATLWASTQTPFAARDEVAGVLGISSEQVRVMPIFVGGGFGGKSQNLQVTEVARCAKLLKRPVPIQLAWTRKEEFYNDTFRPAAIVKIKSGLDSKNQICSWAYDVYYAGDRGAAHFYNIPHSRTRAYGELFDSASTSAQHFHPFKVGAWRAPGNSTNTFARESQIDIMAAKAGIDPVEFRLRHFADAQMQTLLKMAADKFGWKPGKGPSGRGYGVACGLDAGTAVAMIAEVAAEKSTGQIRVKRVVVVQDMGQVVNPEGAAMQMEGCINMGLGYALTERLTFKEREILDTNFDTYKIARFSWVPKIETFTVANQNAPAQGGGEPAIITVGAAIANALYDATGARLFQLPLTPERVLLNLKSNGTNRAFNSFI